MSPKMVLMGDRKQKRPIKSRKTPKKAKNQKMSENSPNQKKQIRRNEEYSTKPEEKTYKTNKKPGIKKLQTYHRKERGNEHENSSGEEKEQKKSDLRSVKLSCEISNNERADNCEIISDQGKPKEIEKMAGRVKNICIIDNCDSGFTWTRTDVLIRHLMITHKMDKEIAREAALNYQIKAGASSKVIKGLKDMNIENVLKEKLFEDSSADAIFADAKETVDGDEEDSFANAKPIGSSTQEGERRGRDRTAPPASVPRVRRQDWGTSRS